MLMFIKGSGRPDFRYGRIREIRLFSINRHILEENTGRYILKLHTKAYLILHNKPRHIKRFPEVESFWPRLKTLEKPNCIFGWISGLSYPVPSRI